MSKHLLLFGLFFLPFLGQTQTAITFEKFELSSDTIRDGSDQVGQFEVDQVIFPNVYSTDFGGFWAGGWAISGKKDSIDANFTNLFGARPAAGNLGTLTYAVGQQNAILKLSGEATGSIVRGLYVTNTTYAHGIMRDGDPNGFATIFGGDSGDEPDFFLLTIKGYKDGALLEDSIDFYLADYRFSDNAEDYVIDDWTYVSTESLGEVDSLLFIMDSSDKGANGINTPLFFAIDDIIVETPILVPDLVSTFEENFVELDSFWNGVDQSGGFTSGDAFFPNVYSTDFGGFWAGGWAISSRLDSVDANFTNLYGAKPRVGEGGSLQYAVGQQNAIIELQGEAAGRLIEGIHITNTTYAHGIMRDGDPNGFATIFGGDSGDEPDFFKLTIQAYEGGILKSDSVEFYLADYRFEDNSLDYIVDTWEFVDLTPLGNVDSLLFQLSSSDAGVNGINTPAFFCIDNLRTTNSIVSTTNFSAEQLDVRLFPNPTADWMTIQSNQVQLEAGEITLWDLDGRLVYRNGYQPQIDLRDLERGGYLLNWSDGVQSFTEVVIKK